MLVSQFCLFTFLESADIAQTTCCCIPLNPRIGFFFLLNSWFIVSYHLVYLIVSLGFSVGRDSSVGIATRYGLDGPGIESLWGRDFPHPSRTSLGLTQWVPAHFPGVKAVMALTTHPI